MNHKQTHLNTVKYKYGGPIRTTKAKGVTLSKYSKNAQKVITKTLHEYKQGNLKAGRSKKVVKDRQQAIAIGIDKAKNKGYKTPSSTKEES